MRKRLSPPLTILATLFFWVVSVSLSPAATHWISPTGTASWASCTGTTPLSGTSACSLATANTNAAAGDVVYFRTGTYTLSSGDHAIAPAHSGSGISNRITYTPYASETVLVNGAGDRALFIEGVNYIALLCNNQMTFDVTNYTYPYNWGTIGGAGSGSGSSHNEISHCTFQNTATTTNQGMQLFIGPTTSNGPWATNNWIHDNDIVMNGTGCPDGGTDTIRIGQPASVLPSDGNVNNSIENNFFEHDQHAALESYSMQTVIRNNRFHNEPWSSGCGTTTTNPPTYDNSAYNGKYGHRILEITDDYNRANGVHDLIEGNNIGFASVNQNNDGADNFDIEGTANVIRYNNFYAAFGSGLMFKYHYSSGLGNGGHGGTYNRVYNNTFYKNGFGYTTKAKGSNCDNCPWPLTAITNYYTDSGEGNVIKNNLFSGNNGYALFQDDFLDRNVSYTGTMPNPGPNDWGTVISNGSNGSAVNNYCGTQHGSPSGGCNGSTADPKFTNPDVSNPASTTLPDLTLQSASPAIDGGTYLTTATNSGGGSTNLTVADVMYFQDGTWGSDLAKASAGLGGTMQADWICIATVSNCVQISSVTYGSLSAPAGTIVLASPMTWSNGAPVWLYKKSDGTQVLYGAAPDYGASEFQGSSGGGTVQPPSNLQAVVN